MKIQRILAANLRAERKAKKMSMEQLALRADVGKTTIFEIENEKHEPSAFKVYRLAKALGIGLDKLFSIK